MSELSDYLGEIYGGLEEMSWCEIHKAGFEYCKGRHIEVSEAKDQMSFGDFETILSIIEKATEKDIYDIATMLGNRKNTLAMLKRKKDETK
jgi:hypothetical protein